MPQLIARLGRRIHAELANYAAHVAIPSGLPATFADRA
jgi:hypothetical protein